MHFTFPLVLMSLIVLQQITRIESLVSPILSPDNEAGRPHVARRLRAPLMGRSLLSVSSSNNNYDDDDDVGYLNNELSSSSSINDDDDDLLILNKRRLGVPLFGRRWVINKRRGPLFG